ncbi:MAG: LytR/AlgR family response regulator transcription factor [Burkholderiales bacterium]
MSTTTQPAGALTCVIAEDEALFRAALVKLLGEEWPALKIVAACEDGAEALDAIAANQPQLAFLDIRMPGLTGLDVAAAISEVSPQTAIVFVTAYDQYAIDAFDKGAVDYWLKPVDPARFRTTVARLKERLQRPANDSAIDPGLLQALIDKLGGRTQAADGEAPLTWITASVGRETRLINVSDIIYIQSDNKYTVVMTAESEALLRMPLTDILKRLDSGRFRQIHRSTVVNLHAVAGITRDESGRGTMRLKGRPETLAVSLSYMPFFKNM